MTLTFKLPNVCERLVAEQLIGEVEKYIVNFSLITGNIPKNKVHNEFAFLIWAKN